MLQNIRKPGEALFKNLMLNLSEMLIRPNGQGGPEKAVEGMEDIDR